MGDSGHVGVQRTLESITVGARHRNDLGDIDALVESIRREGLLQPITVTPDGVLVCGRRRLEALRRLGIRTVNVWVRSGITDRLSQLLAEQADNLLHKQLTVGEAESLYRELKHVMAEDAARRQAATRFAPANAAAEDGGGDSPPPGEYGKSREQAARMITGRDSSQKLERVGRLKDLSVDESQPAHIRAIALEALSHIDSGGTVHGAYLRVNTALDLDKLDRIAEDPSFPAEDRAEAARSAAALRQPDPGVRASELALLAADAVARARSQRSATPGHANGNESPHLRLVLLPPRAFVALWTDLSGWSRKYDSEQLALELTDEQWAVFERVLEESTAFAERVRGIRRGTDSSLPFKGRESSLLDTIL